MRLLIFIYSMGGSCAERVSANLANYWVAKGWEITIVTMTQQSLDFYELYLAVKRIALELTGWEWQCVDRIVGITFRDV